MDSNKKLLYNGIYDGKSFYMIFDYKGRSYDAKEIINGPTKYLLNIKKTNCKKDS